MSSTHSFMALFNYSRINEFPLMNSHRALQILLLHHMLNCWDFAVDRFILLAIDFRQGRQSIHVNVVFWNGCDVYIAIRMLENG